MKLAYRVQDDRPASKSYPRSKPLTQSTGSSLLAAYDDLQARDIFVTGRSLADGAGTSVERAWTFLRHHRAGTPTETRARQRQQKLEHACVRLEAQGVRVTSPLLAKEAGVAKKSAIDFLSARRRVNHATA